MTTIDTNEIIVQQQQQQQNERKKDSQSTLTMLIFEMYVWSPAITC